MNEENKNIAPQNKLVVFQNKNIRRIWQDEEWFYSVVDIIEVLTDSPTPRQYWGKVKNREFTKLQLSPIWVQLKLEAKDWIDKRLRGIAIRQNLTDEWKERVTTEISKKEKPETFGKNKKVAQRGGKVAGNALKETEKELGRAVSSKQNFLDGDGQLKLDE